MRFTTRQCRECGEPFTPRHARSLFHSNACKQTWYNRRQKRGAELYDFVMADPRDPLIARLIAAYKLADHVLRGGRPSAQDVDTAIMRIPQSYSTAGDRR